MLPYFIVFLLYLVTVAECQVATTMPAIVLTTEEAAEVEDTGRTLTSDWIVGIAMMVLSMACAVAYSIILFTIWNDKELIRMASYKLMFALGIFDVIQCLPHFVTGIFTICQSTFHPGLAKAMGVLATPCYVAYAVLTIFLSFNRLIQLWSPRLDKMLFGGTRINIWIGAGCFFCFSFAVALSVPGSTIHYIPEWYSWDYDYELPYSTYVQHVEMYIEVGGIFVSAIFYAFILTLLLRTKKRFMITSSYMAEIKILIQATVITVYCTILNVLWHNYQYFLPLNIWSYMGLNFIALRQKIRSKRIPNPTGAISMFVRSNNFSGMKTATGTQ
ncbi:unnamed protein product [Caenorhabditis auriculariae]|uniref:Uncharacterized protein n=1 Tax=Caenorhabditis auriculariae TaxID=2777116 RepID=A0A8S1HV75_9PELO|nr:unnamed protein product [Caenorhabditis auriculariae]